MTYTVVTMEVPQAVHDLIRHQLEAAGYGHAIQSENGYTYLDMTHIALMVDAPDSRRCKGRNCFAQHGSPADMSHHSAECIEDYEAAITSGTTITDTDRLDFAIWMIRDECKAGEIMEALEERWPDATARSIDLREVADFAIAKKKELGL